MSNPLGILAGLAGIGANAASGTAAGMAEGEDLKRKLASQQSLDQLRVLDAMLKGQQVQAGATPKDELHEGIMYRRDPRTGQLTPVAAAPQRPPTDLQTAQTEAARARAKRDASGGSKVIDQLEEKVRTGGLDALSPGERAVWNAHHKPERLPEAERAITDWLAAQKPPLADTPANRDKARAALDKRKVDTRGGGADFTPRSLEMYAQAVADGGPMPALGMGKAATEARIKISNRAADIRAERGDLAGSLAIRQATYKANAAALTKVSVQEAQIVPFSRTAQDSLRRAKELSDKIDRTGSPVINRWVMAGRKSVKGDPDVAAFDYHLRLGINEVAKITSTATGGGGVVSDSARHEIEDTINRSMTKQQIARVIEGAEYEMDSRLRHLKEEKAELQNAMQPSLPPTSTPSPGLVVPSLPDPKTAKGKTYRDTETGKRFKSDGATWNEVK